MRLAGIVAALLNQEAIAVAIDGRMQFVEPLPVSRDGFSRCTSADQCACFLRKVNGMVADG